MIRNDNNITTNHVQRTQSNVLRDGDISIAIRRRIQ